MSDVVSVKSTTELFLETTARSFREIGFDNQGIIGYVVGMLNGFRNANALYSPLANEPDFSTEYVSELISRARESDANTRTRIYHHIGDYTLFMGGLFPERVERNGGISMYASAGKRSYLYVANRLSDDTFYLLSDNFNRCVRALNFMRENYIRLDSPEEWHGGSVIEVDRSFMENRMLDAINRWNTTGKSEDMKTALAFAEDLGYDIAQVFELKNAKNIQKG